MNNIKDKRQTDLSGLDSGCVLRLRTCPRLSIRGYNIIKIKNIKDNRQTDLLESWVWLAFETENISKTKY